MDIEWLLNEDEAIVAGGNPWVLARRLQERLVAERKKVAFFMQKKAEIISSYEDIVKSFNELKAELAKLQKRT